VQARRQPGSLFKPFVYLAALSRRDLQPPITPATILSDTPIALVWGPGEDETWSPREYDGEFLGPITLRQALEESRNIPVVRVAVTQTEPGKTLLPDVVATARRAGITSELKPFPSVALGSFEVSPLEIASAYAVFANGGFRMPPNALIGIVGPNGRKAATRNTPVERVADADAVSLIDSMLEGVVNRGTGASARRLGAQGILAGKTGTTNDGRDAWFIGFSPRLLVAVWVGFDDNRGLNLSGSMAAVPIFADFVRRLPAHDFEAPFPETPGTVQAAIDPTTGYLVTPECPKSAMEIFIAGTEPTQRCPVHGGGGYAIPESGF
jgi:penicillin-binding protein 1B